LHEVHKELLRIKKLSLNEFGISIVDERLLSAIKEALETTNGNS
jgi:hypothetical protein